jgi:ubiquinone/menaquinone biosynthesis C-methylase UbiE
MDIVQQNNDYFSKEIESYKVSYLRTDEVWLKDHYMKGKILILGCGTGRVLGPLKEVFGSKNIVGIDLNLDMVKEAEKNHPDISVYQMDATKLEFKNNTYDTVFFPFHGIDCIYPDIYKAVKEAKRVLKPSGIFILSSHNRFFIKKLYKFFDGNYSDAHGLMMYRTTFIDWFRLKKYFKKVKVIQRISIAVSWKNANWKDIVYKLFPFFNKSTYFVCQGKK